jgi:hypothetical protein
VLLGNPLAGVRHEIGGPYGTRAERWVDLGPGDRKQRYTSPARHVLHGTGGQLLYQYTVIVERPDTVRVDVVDYAKRTWTTYRRHITPLPATPMPSSVPVGPLGIAVGFARGITSGGYRVLGSETIGGRETLHLRSNPPAGHSVDVWIDASTYLVLRELEPGSRTTVDYDYLRRTPANVAKTRLKVPPGFRHSTSAAPPPQPNF